MMDKVSLVLTALVSFGIILTFFSLIFIKKDNTNFDYSKCLDDKIDIINKAIEEADMSINELDDFSKTILRELDIKYNEILHLYSLIDEKKSEVASLYSNFNNKNEYISLEIKNKDLDRNKKSSKIIEFYNQGMTESEIARKLDIGKGEVNLLIGMAKGR